MDHKSVPACVGKSFEAALAVVKAAAKTHRCFSAGPKRLTRTLLIPALVLFLLGACSVAFVDGPSPRPSTAGKPCTTSYAAPTLDLFGVPATFLLGFGFGGFERSLEAVKPDDDDTFGNLEKASLAASGVLLASGVYGLVQVGRCRRSREPGGDSPLAPSRPDDPLPSTLFGRLVPAGYASPKVDETCGVGTIWSDRQPPR